MRKSLSESTRINTMHTAEWILAGLLLLLAAGAAVGGLAMWRQLQSLQRRLDRIEGLKERLRDPAEQAAREALPADVARLPDQVSGHEGRLLELEDNVGELFQGLEKLRLSWKNLS